MADSPAGIVEYPNARRLARRFLADHQNDPFRGRPPVLEELIEFGGTAGEIALGTHEIPLKKVVGTYTTARAEAFAGNFMPLMNESSEFAYKWRNVYNHHIKDGISDPVKVYEYLGLFYVIEGNKRVSVMKYVEAYSIRAEIIRILPRCDEPSDEIKIYYEFIDYDPRSFAWNDMWFSQPGSFTRLIEEAGQFAASHEALGGMRLDAWLPRAYADFALQYERAGFKRLSMTTGDAFLIYIMVYGFPYETPSETLKERVLACEAQFRRAAGDGAVITIEEGDTPSSASGRGLLFGIGSKRAVVLFCYHLPPEASSWTRAHEAGRLYAERYFEERVDTFAALIDPDDAYNDIKDAIEDFEPDILFTVGSQFAADSLKTALEHPDLLVFNCNHINADIELNTYFCKLYEQTFILGAIAGAFTKTGVIGFCDLPLKATGSTYAANAFAQGARLVNRNAAVKRYRPRVNYDSGEDKLSRRTLAAAGADVIFCQYPVYNTPISKPFDDIYGMLVSNDTEGRVLDYLAAAAWDWSVHYIRIIGGYLEGTFEPLAKNRSGAGSLYFWLGVASGAAPIYRVENTLGADTSRLATMVQGLIEHAALHPFTGPVRDDAGILRIAPGETPSLTEIQTMDWNCDIVQVVASD